MLGCSTTVLYLVIERFRGGDAVVGTLTVDSIRQTGGHSMVVTRSELTSASGEPLATATSTIVVRGEGS